MSVNEALDFDMKLIIIEPFNAFDGFRKFYCKLVDCIESIFGSLQATKSYPYLILRNSLLCVFYGLAR